MNLDFGAYLMNEFAPDESALVLVFLESSKMHHNWRNLQHNLLWKKVL